MPKTNVSSSVGVPLFGIPVSYPPKSCLKTILVSAVPDASGKSVISHVCVEEVRKDRIPLVYSDVTLSNLISKGVTPKALDILDTNKLGIDNGIDEFANHLVSNSDKYVERGNSYDKSEK